MISITGNAQDILDGAYDRKTTYENRKVQPYPHLRQADVMWSRKIWREIDLREKANHPFYYPAIQPGQEAVNDRRSLIDVIMDAVIEGSITAYANAIYDDEFETDYNGRYRFEFLRKGDYTIYTYSDSSDVNTTYDYPVFRHIEIKSNNSTNNLDDFVIEKNQ